MSFSPAPRPAVAAAVLALLLGVGGCGGDDEPDAPSATASGSPSASSTASASPTDPVTGFSVTPDPGGTPPAGLPTDFPTADVPVLDGVVTGKTGSGGGTGPAGWVLEMKAAGTAKECFDRAAAALIGAGFAKGPEATSGGNRQAQFTSAEYAVIISVEADGTDQCRLGYEVGEVSR